MIEIFEPIVLVEEDPVRLKSPTTCLLCFVFELSCSYLIALTPHLNHPPSLVNESGIRLPVLRFFIAIYKVIIISPKHKRAEERAPVLGS
jgi:hypothetical protein